MKKFLPVFLLMSILAMSACTTPGTASVPGTPASTQIPSAVPTKSVDVSTVRNSYTNGTFGLHFQYPSKWYGPEEYISGQTLRVEVGSDVVYPYGEPPEKPSDVRNSYHVVIQYTKNNQDAAWKDTYQSLTELQDGWALAGTRSLIIRVKQ